MTSLLERDSQKGNILDVIDRLEIRVRKLEEVVGGSGGGASGSSSGSSLGVAELVSVSENDAQAGYLNGKLVGDAPLILIEQNDSGDESLLISISAHLHPDAHHNRDHNIISSDHAVTGAALDVIGVVSTDQLGILTPSSSPGVAAALLRTTADGGLTLDHLTLTADLTLSGHIQHSADLEIIAGSIILSATDLQDASWVYGTSGWGVTSGGEADFREVHTDSLIVAASVGSSLIPHMTDTYDLGSATTLWRKGWLSELESVLFVQNSVQVTGGWWMVPHGSGTLAADVTGTDLQVDFGAVMTPGDFVLLRGNMQVEYLQVGSPVTGTIYNATRNLDGSGANAWPAGQVFVVLGTSGDGRIEFDAQTAGPRVSVIEQGATYNGQAERVRIGDLTGWGSLTGYGIAIGLPAGNRLTYDPAHGLVIAGDGAGVTNIDGGNIQADTITTTQLTADAIDSMTVTGATIRTAASGARIEMNTARIFGTDGATVQWEAATADGKFTAGGGDVILDEDGITLIAGSFLSTQNILKWVTSGGTTVLSLAGDSSGNAYVRAGTGGHVTIGVGIAGAQLDVSALEISTNADINLQANDLRTSGGVVVGDTSQNPSGGEIRLYHTDGTWVGQASVIDNTWLRLNQSTGKNIYTPNAVQAIAGFSAGAGVIPAGGSISYVGDLRPYRNSTAYTGYVFVPLISPLTSASWDGDAKSAGNQTIYLGSAFGVPSDARAIAVRLSVRDANVGAHAALGPTLGAYAVLGRVQVANQYVDISGITPCNATGDVNFFSSEAIDNVVIQIYGYFI